MAQMNTKKVHKARNRILLCVSLSIFAI